MALESFKPEDIRLLQESPKAFQQLEKIGNVWISPDIAIEKTTVASPGQLIYQDVNIILNKKNLPPTDINRGVISLLDWSVRSYLAQSGVDIMFHHSSLTDSMIKDINDGKDVSVPLDIYNHGQRAVELDGTIMRFFWVNDSKRLRGEELENAIKSGEFSVEGIEGEDWSLEDAFFDDEEMARVNENNPDRYKKVCVKLKLNDTKLYIPYAEDPVRIQNSRRDLPKFLRPIPEDIKLDFQIGETPKVKLGSNIIGVINLGVYDKSQRHIHSPLIDSGTEGHVRTETRHGLPFVEFFLYRK